MKLHKAFFSKHNAMKCTMQENNCKKHKHVEVKQYATKEPMDHWRNQRGNLKKI